MENVDTEKLILENDNTDLKKIFEEKIINNKYIPENIKNQWKELLSENYTLKCLSKSEINTIMNKFNLLEQITLNFLINNSEEYFILQCEKIELSLNLNRAFVEKQEEKSKSTFLSRIFGVK